MEYVLINKEQFRSRTGARMWRITWVCLDDLTHWETSIAEDMDNFLNRGWRSVCNNPDPWGIYTGLKRTTKTSKSGVPIITADSKQKLLQGIDTQEIAIQLVEAAMEPTT